MSALLFIAEAGLPDRLVTILVWLAGFAIFLVAALAPLAAFLWLVYWALTLPMRRSARARLFIDVLELGLQEGRTPELTVMEAAATRDRALGAGIHPLADLLKGGLRLGVALEIVPSYLPRRVAAMLQAGERIGDVQKVLGACRLTLGDAVSKVRSAMNYLVVLAFVVTPAVVILPLIMRVRVLPAFQAVFAGLMEGGSLPAFTRLVATNATWMSVIQVMLLVVLWAAALLYIAGPRCRRWFAGVAPGLPDAMAWRLPWKRKRIQRDFAAMLAVLLDSGVPEPDALTLAARAGANRVLEARANRALARLQAGEKLPEAIRAIDVAGELEWRLTNAVKRARSFEASLAGWMDALEAKAFQQEQAAAQLTTTGLLLLNGLMIGALMIGLFLALIHLIEVALLW